MEICDCYDDRANSGRIASGHDRSKKRATEVKCAAYVAGNGKEFVEMACRFKYLRVRRLAHELLIGTMSIGIVEIIDKDQF